MERIMKDFQNYTESPYFDMKNSFGYDGNCGCNPCNRQPIPNCNRPIRPPHRPPENCFPPQPCFESNDDCDELLYLLTGILIGRKFK